MLSLKRFTAFIAVHCDDTILLKRAEQLAVQFYLANCDRSQSIKLLVLNSQRREEGGFYCRSFIIIIVATFVRITMGTSFPVVGIVCLPKNWMINDRVVCCAFYTISITCISLLVLSLSIFFSFYSLMFHNQKKILKQYNNIIPHQIRAGTPGK